MTVPPLPPLVKVPPEPAGPSLAGELQANNPVTASHVMSLCLALPRPVTVPKRDTTSKFDMARIVSWPLDELVLGEDKPWVFNSSASFGVSVDF
jgi:hypothetical protein